MLTNTHAAHCASVPDAQSNNEQIVLPLTLNSVYLKIKIVYNVNIGENYIVHACLVSGTLQSLAPASKMRKVSAKFSKLKKTG